MIEYNKEKIAFSRELRKHMTPCESKLWYQFLRNYPIKFRRQRIVGEYISDFYCAKAHLIIEIDGECHNSLQQTIYDKTRTNYLSQEYFRVLRISNEMLNNDFYQVCEYIDKVVQAQIVRLNNELN